MKNKLLLFLVFAVFLITSCESDVREKLSNEERCEIYKELSEECRAELGTEAEDIFTHMKDMQKCMNEIKEKVGFDELNQEEFAACQKKVQQEQTREIFRPFLEENQKDAPCEKLIPSIKKYCPKVEEMQPGFIPQSQEKNPFMALAYPYDTCTWEPEDILTGDIKLSIVIHIAPSQEEAKKQIMQYIYPTQEPEKNAEELTQEKDGSSSYSSKSNEGWIYLKQKDNLGIIAIQSFFETEPLCDPEDFKQLIDSI